MHTKGLYNMHNNIDFVVSIVNNYWKKGQKILEIGCGPAFLRKFYGEDYTGSDITDVDYTPTIPRDVDVVCGADNLKFADNSFDIVIIKSAFFLFDDHAKALAEANRVLKTNGKLIIFDYNKKTQRMLQSKEGHTNYPCWTQLGLRKRILQSGFNKAKFWIADVKQPNIFTKIYHIARQEVLGTWAIVSAIKTAPGNV